MLVEGIESSDIRLKSDAQNHYAITDIITDGERESEKMYEMESDLEKIQKGERNSVRLYYMESDSEHRCFEERERYEDIFAKERDL